MVRIITESGLKRLVDSNSDVTVKRDGRNILGVLGYTGDRFFVPVPVGTGKFFVHSAVYSTKEKGFIGTRKSYLRNGENIEVLINSEYNSTAWRPYKVKLR